MKVLFLARKTLWSQPGGDSIQVAETRRALESQGHEVELLLRPSRLHKQLRRKHYDVVHSFNLGRMADHWPVMRARRRDQSFRWVLSTIWIDYQSYENQRGVLWRYLPDGLRERLKMVFRALRGHDTWPSCSLLWSRQPIQRIARAADHLICTSQRESQRIQRAFNLNAQRVHVILPGTDHHPIHTLTTGERKGWVVVGRVEGIKNQLAAVQAWKILAAQGFREPLTLIGNAGANHGRHTRAVQAAIRDAVAAGAQVRWRGPLPADLIAVAMSGAQGVLVPSLFETFGLTAVEGLRQGARVVLSTGAESGDHLTPFVTLAEPTAEGIAHAVMNDGASAPFPVASMTWGEAAQAVAEIYATEPRLRIAISGSRGVPNRYGGYEALAEELALRLADMGHEIHVSTSSRNPEKTWSHPMVHRNHHWDPEGWMGSSGQFIYDYLSLRRVARLRPDFHITLGTTSSGPWLRWKSLRGSAPLAVHMDGLEWQRGKYSERTRKYLKRAEAHAAKAADVLIADNQGIEDYLQSTYDKPIVNIAYGAQEANRIEEPTNHVKALGINGEYALVLCRLVPENNIRMTLEALLPVTQVVVVGHWETAHGKELRAEFGQQPHFIAWDATYDEDVKESLKQAASLYVHGHSVGGTNPGLLEAMASGCPIAAHDNVFNRDVLRQEGTYFDSAESLVHIWESRDSLCNSYENLARYAWSHVAEDYLKMIQLHIS